MTQVLKPVMYEKGIASNVSISVRLKREFPISHGIKYFYFIKHIGKAYVVNIFTYTLCLQLQ